VGGQWRALRRGYLPLLGGLDNHASQVPQGLNSWFGRLPQSEYPSLIDGSKSCLPLQSLRVNSASPADTEFAKGIWFGEIATICGRVELGTGNWGESNW